MQQLTLVLVLVVSCHAVAQQAPPPYAPDPNAPPVYAPPPPMYGAPPPGYGAPPPGYGAAPMPFTTMAPPTPIPPRLIAQWRGARVMTGFGSAIGLVSTGMSLSSAIYIPATGYPPSASSTTQPKASDTSQILSMTSSGSAVLGVVLAAGSLGWRHHILAELGQDPGRGLFIGGTVVGAIGVVSIVTSWVVGLSNVTSNPRDRSIIALASSLGGASLCNMGTAMYAKDSANTLKVWKKLTTF